MVEKQKVETPSTTSHRKDFLMKKALNLNWMTPEAKVVLLALILYEKTEEEISIVELDEMCQMTLSDADIGAIFLRNSLDLPTMVKYELTSKINVGKDASVIKLSEDWKLNV